MQFTISSIPDIRFGEGAFSGLAAAAKSLGDVSVAALVIDSFLAQSGLAAKVTTDLAGIGIETAIALASAGADVTLAVRNMDSGHQAAQLIASRTGNDAVHVAALELVGRGSSWQPLSLTVNRTFASLLAMAAAAAVTGHLADVREFA